MRASVLPVVVLCLLAPAASRAQVFLGPEFQVNVATVWAPEPAVASDAAGNFVVSWVGDPHYNPFSMQTISYGIFARRYAASGDPIDPSELRANTYTSSQKRTPTVTLADDGAFVVAWMSLGQDGSGAGIFARRFDGSGQPAPEFQMNAHTTGGQNSPAAATTTDGTFVVWHGQGAEGPRGLFGRRLDPAGTPLADPFRVNAYTTKSVAGADVAADGLGNVVVVWQSREAGPAWPFESQGHDVIARRYDASGSPQGAEFRVNLSTLGYQMYPAVAASRQGRFVVVWENQVLDPEAPQIVGRVYDASGQPGPEFQVNAYTTGYQRSPDVAMDRHGNFAVVWRSQAGYGAPVQVFARVFDASATPQGPDFLVPSDTTGLHVSPAVAGDESGRFVVTWVRAGSDASPTPKVMARRFAADLIFKDGFESGDLSAWSAAATDGGDLVVSDAAAMRSTSLGLQGTVDDAASLHVQDDTPADEPRYRARFHVDTNGFDPGEASGNRRTRLFLAFQEAPSRRVAAIVLRRLNGAYAVMGRARLDDGTQVDTGFFPIADGPHAIELEVARATGPDAGDGTFRLWLDGALVSSLSGLDNSRAAVDFVRMGALGPKPAARGTLLWDEFESRRVTSIGP